MEQSGAWSNGASNLPLERWNLTYHTLAGLCMPYAEPDLVKLLGLCDLEIRGKSTVDLAMLTCTIYSPIGKFQTLRMPLKPSITRTVILSIMA
jgi:hypothetical protein